MGTISLIDYKVLIEDVLVTPQTRKMTAEMRLNVDRVAQILAVAPAVYTISLQSRMTEITPCQIFGNAKEPNPLSLS